MKKHNEGYTLVLVLVVILVLAACATAVLSFSVQNLKTQQRMVERMQAKYEAQGEIEQIVAQLVQDSVYINEDGTALGSDKKEKNHKAVKKWLEKEYGIVLADDKIATEEDSFTCNIQLSSTKGSYSIVGDVILRGKIEVQTVDNKENYHMSEMEIDYKSYKTSTVTASEGGSGE